MCVMGKGRRSGLRKQKGSMKAEGEREGEEEKMRTGTRKIYARFVHGRAHAHAPLLLVLPEVGLPVGV